MPVSTQGQLSNKDVLHRQLLALGSKYHIYHPYHILMNAGRLTKPQIQGWVLNRYYYQIMIPRKDAAIMANCEDQSFRKLWIQRILDHDGEGEQPGGISAWLLLAKACGLPENEVTSLKKVLPGVKFAVDAYFRFAQTAPWQEAACSSLTELFAPEIHKQRLANWPSNYPWIDQQGFGYFQKRLTEARRDVEHGLAFTLDYFTEHSTPERAIEIVEFKLNVLWSMLDAMSIHYGINTDLTFKLNSQYRLQFEPAQDSHVLLYAEGMIKLNNSAAEILGLCDGTQSQKTITTTLVEKFEQPEIRYDVQQFLGDAVNFGWLDVV